MSSFLRISHVDDRRSTRFPGAPENRIRTVLAIENGDPCNAAELTLFNHGGTHVDLPNHYVLDGRRVTDCDIPDYVFERPVLVEITAGAGEPITGEMLQVHRERIEAADLLLLKTGLGACRREPAYADNPYLALDAAHFLRALPGLRALGLDVLSVSNGRYLALGHDVHRVLLREERGSPPFMIVEDMDLSRADIIHRFRRVFVVPLFVEGVDSMPCTVFGEYQD